MLGRIQKQAAEARASEAGKIAERVAQVPLLQRVVTDCAAAVNRDKVCKESVGLSLEYVLGKWKGFLFVAAKNFAIWNCFYIAHACFFHKLVCSTR